MSGISIDTTRLAYNQREDVYFSREIGGLFITVIMLCSLRGAHNGGGSNVSFAIVPDRHVRAPPPSIRNSRDSAERSRIIIASRSQADISQIQTKRLLPVSSRVVLPSRPSGIVRRLLIIRDILCVRFQWSASPTASRLINYPGEYSRRNRVVNPRGSLEEEAGAKLATSDRLPLLLALLGSGQIRREIK